MKNLMTSIFATVLVVSFLTSCQSKSGKRLDEKMRKTEMVKTNHQTQQLESKTIAEMDSVFNQSSAEIGNFVNIHNNANDSYEWESKKTDDQFYNLVRIAGTQQLKDFLVIEKRSSKVENSAVIGYVIERTKTENSVIYSLETSEYRDGQERKSKTNYIPLNNTKELMAALDPFHSRLAEAKESTEDKISRIQKISRK